MLRKIIKYTLRTLIVILLAVLLAPALLYVPAVQDFIRGKAVGYASEALGMDLSVGRIRLAFPLDGKRHGIVLAVFQKTDRIVEV